MLLLREGSNVDGTLRAANAMYAVLRNMGCTCTHNVPYAGCKVPQVVVQACARCRALAGWDAIGQQEISTPVCGVLVEVHDNESNQRMDTADGAIAEH
jgi:hypothetical protein